MLFEYMLFWSFNPKVSISVNHARNIEARWEPRFIIFVCNNHQTKDFVLLEL